MKSMTIMDDSKYTPRPLIQITSDPNYKVDKNELEKSIKKSQEAIAFVQRIRSAKGM